MNETLKVFLSNDIMWAILAFVVILIVVWLYNLNSDDRSPINLIDLISTDGKLEERKITRFGAWIISSWGLIYLISVDKLEEWYFIAYMGAWVANALIGSYINKNRDLDYMKYRSKDYEQFDTYMEYEGNAEELNNKPTRRKTIKK